MKTHAFYLRAGLIFKCEQFPNAEKNMHHSHSQLVEGPLRGWPSLLFSSTNSTETFSKKVCRELLFLMSAVSVFSKVCSSEIKAVSSRSLRLDHWTL